MKRLWLSVAVGALAAAGCSSEEAPEGQDPDESGAELSPTAIAQIESLLAEKAARTPALRKIASSLIYQKRGTFQAALEQMAPDPEQRVTSLRETDASGRILVDIRGDMSALGGRIEALGGETVDVRRRSMRAWISLDRVEDLAAENAVRSIRPAFLATTFRADIPGGSAKFRVGTRPERIAAVQRAAEALAASPVPVPTDAIFNSGSVQSQGDGAHNAARARRIFGVDGTGIKVGVLSDSDDFLEASIASGDLPPDVVTVPGQNGRPGSGEGTAMMQIVHDIAPGAKLFFATAALGPESFADNIRRLRFEFGCDVLIDDVVYFVESPYTDDIVAQAVNDVTADGALFFSAAGNLGNFDDGTSSTWEGDFKPAGSLPALPEGTTVHNFGNGVVGNRIERSGGPMILHWSDPGTLDNPLSNNDYDLFVLDNNLRNVIVAATDIQDGTGLPFEILEFEIPPPFKIVVVANPGVEPRAIRVVHFFSELAISTPGSTWGHSAAADAFSVAAVAASEAGDGVFGGGQTTPVELFSSDGPRRIFNRPDGSPINPDRPGRTFASGGGVARAKPDIAAADGVATTLPPGSGLNPFFGTSASAPHAGAIAALMKASTPTATPAKIRSSILVASIDIESQGTDRNSGRGILSAFTGLQRVGARPAVNFVRGAVTVIPLGNDVVLPNSAAQVNIALDNIGGLPATAVSSVLSSTSANVLILQGNSAYPTVGAEGSALNATPFAFFVDPATPCGATLPFTLTVSFTGNSGQAPKPFVTTFSVQVGRPAAAQRFAFAGASVAIPDASATGVRLPLNVTFPGGIAQVRVSLDGTACTGAEGATTVGVDHTWVGDLTFLLTSPSGRTVTLLDRAGGPGNSGNNFCQTQLQDGAANSIQQVLIAQAPFTGTFHPAQPLAQFTGEQAVGTWNLFARDSVPADVGSVRAFSVEVSGFVCGPP
jgi:subtilisin-like proprotein convertase family protein